MADSQKPLPVALSPLPLGVSQIEFDEVIAVGRERGHLSQEELMDALHNVELTAEVLETLLARVKAEGVTLVVEEVEEDAPADEVALRREARQAASRGATRARRDTNG